MSATTYTDADFAAIRGELGPIAECYAGLSREDCRVMFEIALEATAAASDSYDRPNVFEMPDVRSEAARRVARAFDLLTEGER